MDKFGTRKVFIGHHQPYPWPCPNCKELDTVWFHFYTEYYYAGFVVPMMPYEKDAHANCTNCQFRINSVKFNAATKDEFKRLRRQFRNPWYTYIGVSIGVLLGLLILYAILRAIFD